MNKTIFCGLLTIDIQFKVEKYPKENTKNKAGQYAINVGGPATNAAIASSFLGDKSSLITSVGKNPFTKMIETELDEHGTHFIDIDYCNEVTPPFASVITSENSGDRTVFSYHPEHETIQNNIPDYVVEGANAVLIDGFFPETAMEICKSAIKNGVPIIFDGGSWKKQTPLLLPYIDIAICSADFSPTGQAKPHVVIDHLVKNGVRKVAITRGQKSIMAYEGGDVFEVKPPKIKAVDTLGAGDIFHGAFTHFYSLGYDFSSSLKVAAEVAAESCKSFGTRQWMNLYKENILRN
jgi:sugar/nucleoside kinase (ribokinase family)